MTPNDLRKLRESGKRPDMLVCSFLGPLRNVPAPVMAVTGQEDPRLFRGLDIVLAHDGSNVDAVINFADRVMEVGVWELEAWNVFEDLWVSIVSLGDKYISRVPAAF